MVHHAGPASLPDGCIKKKQRFAFIGSGALVFPRPKLMGYVKRGDTERRDSAQEAPGGGQLAWAS